LLRQNQVRRVLLRAPVVSVLDVGHVRFLDRTSRRA
jgi:hypothetical protein